MCFGDAEGDWFLAPPLTDVWPWDTEARYWAIVAGKTDARLGSRPGKLGWTPATPAALL